LCAVKKPKISKTEQEKDKELPVLRNPFLDGMLGDIAALRSGTSAFRIDLLNPLTIPVGGGIGGVGPGAGGGSTGGASSGGGGSTSGGGTFSGGTVDSGGSFTGGGHTGRQAL
jgi:hypothetical protein